MCHHPAVQSFSIDTVFSVGHHLVSGMEPTYRNFICFHLFSNMGSPDLYQPFPAGMPFPPLITQFPHLCDFSSSSTSFLSQAPKLYTAMSTLWFLQWQVMFSAESPFLSLPFLKPFYFLIAPEPLADVFN